MDPVKALGALREASRRAHEQQEADTDEPQFCVVDNATVTAILDNWDALDEWMTNRGFSPW